MIVGNKICGNFPRFELKVWVILRWRAINEYQKVKNLAFKIYLKKKIFQNHLFAFWILKITDFGIYLQNNG